MAIDWRLYQARLTLDGQTFRERVLAREQALLRQDMLKSPAMKTVSVAGAPMHMLMHATDRPSEKRFSLLPGDCIDIGAIVVWNEMHWLVTQVDFDDELQRGGRIVQCNRQIRWQNKESLAIIERWCLVTKPYTSNIDEGTVISVSGREFKVQLPYDDETRLLDLDKRFMLEVIDGKPRTYKCTSVDQSTNKYQDIDGGFIVLNLTQDEAAQPGDNVELMICNYIAPGDAPAPPPPPTAGLRKCEISGRSTIKAGLGSRSYKAIFYASDGVTEDSSVTAVWSVEVPAGMESHIKWTPNGNSMELEADEETVGCTIRIWLTDPNTVYFKSYLDIEVMSSYA